MRTTNNVHFTAPLQIINFNIISDSEVLQQAGDPFLPWTEGRRCVVNVTAWARTWRTRRTSCPPPPCPCPAPPPSSWLTSADSTPQLLNSRTWLHGKLSCGAWSQIQSPSSTQQRQDSRIQPGGRAALVWSWFTNCKCRKRLLESGFLNIFGHYARYIQIYNQSSSLIFSLT